MTASRACGELVAQELVRIVDSTEVPRRYALVDPQTPLGTTARLTDPADLT